MEVNPETPTLACRKCGERYYKKYPKRTAEYELCSRCGVFFKRTEKDQNLCQACLDHTEEVKKKKRSRKLERIEAKSANLF